MSLSISTSDIRWRAFVIRYVLWTLALGVAFIVALIMLDPYGTGRLTPFVSHDVPQFGQRLAAASLGRQPQFDTAIIGNSTIQLVDPAKIDAKDMHAVSLAIPGTGPREQLSVASWFLRHHPQAKALIIGIDGRWCESNRAPDLTHPFPFWLYGDDNGEYLANMMQYQTFESAGRKIRMLAGLAPALAANGYNDYDADRNWDRAGFRQRLKEPDEEESPTLAMKPPYDFLAAPMLRDFLAQVPADTAVVLVMPPQFRPGIAGNAALQQNACAATYRDVAAQRPRTQLVNFLTRDDLTSNETDFWDRFHYRARVARQMEEIIDKTLR